MSDTSIVSRISSYDGRNRRTPKSDHSSFWNRYWFHTITILLSLIIFITSSILAYVLYRQAQRDEERRRIRDEFKRKHGLANKILDMVTKNGIVSKWFKANKGQTLTIFRQVMTDMVETIFSE